MEELECYCGEVYDKGTESFDHVRDHGQCLNCRKSDDDTTEEDAHEELRREWIKTQA